MASKAAAAATTAAIVSAPSEISSLLRPHTAFSTGFHAHILIPRSRKRSASTVISTQRRLTHHTETIAALQTFRKRHSEAKRLHAHNASLPTTVDFAHYRSVLKNKAIVDDAEKLFNEFKPVTYDVGAHIKAIEAFETKAVCSTVLYAPATNTCVHQMQVAKAQETEQHIEEELKNLQATLANIEEARPFEDLTVRFLFFPARRQSHVMMPSARSKTSVPRIPESPKP